MKKFSKIMALAVSGAMLFTACSSNAPAKTEKTGVDSAKKLKIVTSIYPMYDFAKKVAGDKADVENIIPAGTEAHDWEPSPDDIKKIETANILVYNGAGMEEWIEDVQGSISNKDLVLVEAVQGIDLIKNEEHEEHEHHDEDANHEKEHKEDADHKDEHKEDADHKEDGHEHHHHGEFDPHTWLSIKNAKKEMENIKNALVTADAANKDYYEENYKKYAEEFDKLDSEYATALKDFNGKSIVVAHEAFAYLGHDYGIKQLGIEGVFEESDPSPAKMKEVAEFVKANGVKTIFFESLTSPELSETIAKETGAKTAMLNPLEGLTEDELKAGKDYVSIMKENLTTLVDSFK